MKFIAIDPTKHTVEVVEAEDLTDVFEQVGLQKGRVDFGTLHRYPENGDTINIVVYEFGLQKPPDQGKFFSIGAGLFEGGAILFAADAMGDTVNLKAKPPVMFYRSYREVEAAIARGEVRRPATSVNGEVVWEWNKD